MIPVTDCRRWLAVDAPLHSDAGSRSADLLERVVAQFDVEHNPRYAPDGATYCSTYAWDVTTAMGCPLPWWVSPSTFDPAKPGDRSARELGAMDGMGATANAWAWWLPRHGDRHGWRHLAPETAQEWANMGKPVVGVLGVERGHGHIVVALPGEWTAGGPWCSQAGAVNHARTLATRCFGNKLDAVTWWGHG